MRRIHAALSLALALGVPQASRAQRDTVAPPVLPVRTFHLTQLAPDQAAKLVSPYVQGQNTGVFSAGSGMRAITVRAPDRILATVDSVLKANDRPPRTIVLRFQLIAAEDSAVHDAAIAGVDAALRSLFRFRGYRLLGEGAAAVGEGSSMFQLTLNAAAEPPGLEHFTVTGQIGDLVADGDSGSVDLHVSLEGPMVKNASVGGASMTTRLSTGLTLPIGQTIVLGSAAAGGLVSTVILAVRAELATSKH
jgi:hypothetical protein